MSEYDALVADVGSFQCRVGYAGEDASRCFIPSYAGRDATSSNAMEIENQASNNYYYNLNHYRENMAIEHVIDSDGVMNWDLFRNLFENAINNYVKVNVKETPVLITEKPFTSTAARYKMLELMFEEYQVPAFFAAKDATLECYACGRTSGLVVDIGASGTSVSPVLDGWIETKASGHSLLGGRALDAYSLLLLKRKLKGNSPLPLYKLSKTFMADQGLIVRHNDFLKNIHPTYDALMNLEMGRDLKESVGRMAEYTLHENDPRYSSIPMVPYELPDGTVINIGIERFQIPELLFDTSPLDLSSPDFADFKSLILSSVTADSNIKTTENITTLISDSIFKCDVETHSSLLSNIILAGGSSAFEGMPDRLKNELENVIHKYAPGVKVKMMANGTNERHLCAWLGGSILASMGSFHELWISKQEYLECGKSIIDRKCP